MILHFHKCPNSANLRIQKKKSLVNLHPASRQRPFNDEASITNVFLKEIKEGFSLVRKTNDIIYKKRNYFHNYFLKSFTVTLFGTIYGTHSSITFITYDV